MLSMTRKTHPDNLEILEREINRIQTFAHNQTQLLQGKCGKGLQLCKMQDKHHRKENHKVEKPQESQKLRHTNSPTFLIIG